MSDASWPNFENESLGDARSFSATFESFNQHMDEVYYTVTVHGGSPSGESTFKVKVDMSWVGDGNWDKPDFAPKLRDAIAAFAKAGKGNVSTDVPVFRF